MGTLFRSNNEGFLAAIVPGAKHRHVNAAHHNRPLLALLLRLASAIVLSIMMALVKLAADSGVHIAEIVFWRQAPTVPMVLVWLGLRGQLGRLRTGRTSAHAKRALIGLASMTFNFTAVSMLPLAEATTIVFTAAIWAVILAATMLHEHVGIYRWSAVALGFTGVLIIAHPGGSDVPLTGAAIGLAAALLIALVSVLIRDLGRTEESLTVVFYFSFFSIPVLALALPFVQEPHDAYQWSLLSGLAVLGLLAQLLLTASLKYGAVSSVMVMDYTSLLWATLLGWQLFGRLPTASLWIGAPLVIAAGLIVAWREHKLSRAASPASLDAAGTSP